ncbi:cupin-like domain-containing protein [Shewanella abyssi]|uniref:cupin-like domain-containing protein n=1 Tax=Shewanella abyssi TaxID=311789 RepID=UPI00200E2752|nr:cupin-like domain-containing protein [Shewanella abyssi]MCL1052068.1 cupin-like domain-containing protein [Shewanella abyssi]
MLTVENSVKQICNCKPGDIPEFVLSSTQPLILKDFAADWPLVKAGKQSAQTAIDYLLEFYTGTPVTACYSDNDQQGRVFYNEQLTGFNFRASQVDLKQVFDKLLSHLDDAAPPTLYVGSTEVNRWLPGFAAANPLAIEDIHPLTSVWIGNQSRIAAHFDFPNNLACSAVGHRRFTLFPPQQIDNLYVGPMEFSPGGQDISLVDFHAPDFDKHPKFEQALKAAQVAELAPGDALFIPSMWWHHVEALDAINVLVTHWWRDTPTFMGRPTNALQHAILSLRSLPIAQRKAWQAMFNHYVFEHELHDTDHIAEHAQGMLSHPIDELSARKLRADLLNKLKR